MLSVRPSAHLSVSYQAQQRDVTQAQIRWRMSTTARVIGDAAFRSKGQRLKTLGHAKLSLCILRLAVSACYSVASAFCFCAAATAAMLIIKRRMVAYRFVHRGRIFSCCVLCRHRRWSGASGRQAIFGVSRGTPAPIFWIPRRQEALLRVSGRSEKIQRVSRR